MLVQSPAQPFLLNRRIQREGQAGGRQGAISISVEQRGISAGRSEETGGRRFHTFQALIFSPQSRCPPHPHSPSSQVELQVGSPQICHTVLLLCTGCRDQTPMNPHPPCPQGPETAGVRGPRDPQLTESFPLSRLPQLWETESQPESEPWSSRVRADKGLCPGRGQKGSGLGLFLWPPCAVRHGRRGVWL